MTLIAIILKLIIQLRFHLTYIDIYTKNQKVWLCGREDLISQGRLDTSGETYLVEWKITSVLRFDRQACKNYPLILVLFTFNNSKSI